MNIYRIGTIQRSKLLLPCQNASMIPGMRLSLQYLLRSRQSRICGLYGYVCSSLCNRGYQRPADPLSDSLIKDQFKLLPLSSVLYPARWRHVTSSLNPSLISLRPTLFTFSNKNSQYEGRIKLKSFRYGHTNESKYRTLLTHLTSLLTSLGLSYLTYKVVTHMYEDFDVLPTARCLSRESCPNKSAKLQTDRVQHPSSKAILVDSVQRKVNGDRNSSGRISLLAAVEEARKLCQRRKEEVGSPGIVVCVSVDGKQVYAEGFGYADVENQIPLKPNSVLRIASISKAITAIIVAKAWEKEQLDIEKAVQHYVPTFPLKEFMGEKVEITVKQLLSHFSGIRHYKSKDDPVYAFDRPIADLVGILKDASMLPFYKTGLVGKLRSSGDLNRENEADNSKLKKAEVSEMERNEYYLTKHFSTTAESLALFADDPLVARPGTKYVYTTFAYILLAAVIESALKKPFTDIVKQTLWGMGLKETYLDLNNPVIYNRARYYVKDAKGHLANAPYVDNSYKWAGGGILSTAEDLVKFGNILLYSAQHQDGDPGPPGFLKSSSIWKFWTNQGIKRATNAYGLGFQIRPANELFGMCGHLEFGVGHAGAAIGVSSALFILPRQNTSQEALPGKCDKSLNLSNKGTGRETACQADTDISIPTAGSKSCTAKCSSHSSECQANMPDKKMSDQTSYLPQGVVVCVMLNMISVSAQDVAEEISRTFENVDFTL